MLSEWHPPHVSASSLGSSVVPTLTDGVVRLDGLTLEDVEAHLAGADEETARRLGWWPKTSTVETVSLAIRCRAHGHGSVLEAAN